jgi:hypothetical protein
MDMIRVINNNREACRGRYDGKDYIFLPGKAVDVPHDAAAHIFGLGKETINKAENLNRLGWLIPGRDTLDDAVAKLDQVVFLRGRTVFPDDETPQPEPDEQQDEDPAPTRASGRRTGGRPHVSGPGGESSAGALVTPAGANPGA